MTGPRKVKMENQRIRLEGVENTRQLGGLVGYDGRKIKNNVLIRSGSLDKICDAGIKTLVEQYNVKQIVDLRRDTEVIENPDREIPGATNRQIVVLQSDDLCQQMRNRMDEVNKIENSEDKLIAKAKSGLVTCVYREGYIADTAKEGFREFFKVLLTLKDGEAILWHCAQGKDRTGLATVLLLTALGVDREVIIEEYMLSAQTFWAQADAVSMMAIKHHLTPDETEELVALASVRKRYIELAIRAAEEEFITMENYIDHGLKISKAEIDQLRETFLEV